MENLTPLQHFAHELRESFRRDEQDKQKRQLDKLEIEGKELINKFASSFSSLFSLLIGSNIDVQAQLSNVNPAILLTYKKNQIAITQDRSIGKVNNWSLFDKIYKATMPNKDFGMASDKTDEHKLIIAIEESLFRTEPVVIPQALQALPA
jgi:hypothetical protein